MKKICCEVIMDLLPLYADDCCSEDSRKLVEEHLKECPECRKKAARMAVSFPQSEEEPEPEEAVIKKGIRKIRKKTAVGVLCCVLAVCLAVVFVVMPVANQVRGEGLTYSNIRDWYQVRQYLSAIKDGDYEEAFSYVNKYDTYLSFITPLEDDDEQMKQNREAIKEKGYDWFYQASKENFASLMTELEERGEKLASYSCKDIYEVIDYQNDKSFMDMDVRCVTEGGVVYYLWIRMEEHSITGIYLSSCSNQAEIRQLIGMAYGSPSTNHAIMDIFYEGQDFDWENVRY